MIIRIHFLQFEKDQVLQNITNVQKQISAVQNVSQIDSSITANTKSESGNYFCGERHMS